MRVRSDLRGMHDDGSGSLLENRAISRQENPRIFQAHRSTRSQRAEHLGTSVFLLQVWGRVAICARRKDPTPVRQHPRALMAFSRGLPEQLVRVRERLVL